MKTTKKNQSQFLLYKGKPFVRCGDVIYYGNLSDPFVVKFELKDKSENGSITIANKVVVQLIDTSPDLSNKKKIVKTSEKDGLYPAIDIANVWLERFLTV